MDFDRDGEIDLESIEPALLSEQVLSDWLRPEEQETWNDFLEELNPVEQEADDHTN